MYFTKEAEMTYPDDRQAGDENEIVISPAAIAAAGAKLYESLENTGCAEFISLGLAEVLAEECLIAAASAGASERRPQGQPRV
jgi:hypothetical protein